METYEEAIMKAEHVARRERRVIYLIWLEEGKRYTVSYELSFFAHAVVEPSPKGDLLITDRRAKLGERPPVQPAKPALDLSVW